MDLKVVYHYHSGFSVQINDILLVFDYWQGDHNEVDEGGAITCEYLKRFRRVYVFVSHSHPDHYDPIITTWKDEVPNITYIVSGDMPIGIPGKRLQPGTSKEFDSLLTVSAYPSTDLGVAFLVEVDGKSIFHAGDLNLWHWRLESSVQEIEEAEEAFYAAIETLSGKKIDVAMFPVDPRQGPLYDAGVNYFIMTMKPQILFPMHWQGRKDVIVDFAHRAGTQQTEVIALLNPGASAEIGFESNWVNIKVTEPPKKEDGSVLG